MKTILLGVICLSGIAFTAVNNSFLYTSSDYKKAQKESRQTDKPMLLYYMADWCTPCQLMEEGTFSDEFLLNKLNEKYVTVEIDRDLSDSKSIIDKYEICCLPTFQITDHKGNTLHISEGSLSGSDFYNFVDIQIPREGIQQNHSIAESGATVSMDRPSMAADKSTFVPGRVDVSAKTYEKIQAAAVNPSNASLAKSKQSSSNAIKTGRLSDAGNTSQSQMKEEMVASPPTAYIEKETLTEEVDPNVAKGMLSILDDMNVKEDVVADATESELKQMSSMPKSASPKSKMVENESITTSSPRAVKVSSTETVTIIKTKNESVRKSESNNTTTRSTGRRVLSKEELDALVIRKDDKAIPNKSNDIAVSKGQHNEAVAGETMSKSVTMVDNNENELAHVVPVEKILKSAKGTRIEYVQAGAFRNIKNADKLRNILIADAQNVIITEDTKDDCSDLKMYKVLLGPIQSDDQRKDLISILSRNDIIGFSVLH